MFLLPVSGIEMCELLGTVVPVVHRVLSQNVTKRQLPDTNTSSNKTCTVSINVVFKFRSLCLLKDNVNPPGPVKQKQKQQR